MAEISITIEGANRVSAMLSAFPRETTQAMNRALKRARESTHTHAARLLSKDMGLNVSDVKGRLRVMERELEFEVRASLKRIPLIDFPARQNRAPHAFTATMPSGHRGIFRRVPQQSPRRGPKPNRSGLPIRELFGPSLGRVLGKYRHEIVSRAYEVFDNELHRLLDRFIQGGVGRGTSGGTSAG